VISRSMYDVHTSTAAFRPVRVVVVLDDFIVIVEVLRWRLDTTRVPCEGTHTSWT
jgi:hypothetical protein